VRLDEHRGDGLVQHSTIANNILLFASLLADYALGGFQMVPVNDPTGERTASLITRYSIYLSALPIASTIAGITNPMFAVEGCLLNGYLLYKSAKFHKDKSNQNARQIFLTSLWYLPCLLGLFILHNKNWEDEEREGVLTEKILAMKEKGLEYCVHDKVEAKDLCPVPHSKKEEGEVEKSVEAKDEGAGTK